MRRKRASSGAGGSERPSKVARSNGGKTPQGQERHGWGGGGGGGGGGRDSTPKGRDRSTGKGKAKGRTGEQQGDSDRMTGERGGRRREGHVSTRQWQSGVWEEQPRCPRGVTSWATRV